VPARRRPPWWIRLSAPPRQRQSSDKYLLVDHRDLLGTRGLAAARMVGDVRSAEVSWTVVVMVSECAGGEGLKPLRPGALPAASQRYPYARDRWCRRRRTGPQAGGQLRRVASATCWSSSRVAPLAAWTAMPFDTVMT